jgi:hypothetical protein
LQIPKEDYPNIFDSSANDMQCSSRSIQYWFVRGDLQKYYFIFTVLSLDTIMNNADMSILFDNDAFEKHCKSVNPLQRLRKNGTHEDLTNLAGEKKNYAQINSMVSQLHLILFELTN